MMDGLNVGRGMAVNMCGSLVLGAMIVSVVLVPASFSVPGAASAVDLSGTSPAFAVDTEWSLYVGYFFVGDIIEWYWSSYDSLVFSLLCTVGETTTQLWGFTYDDGYVVENAGHYGLWWYNDNLVFSASVGYWVAGFTPSTAVSTPIEGSYVNSTTVAVQGSTDSYSSGVLVGPDQWHLSEALWSLDDWSFDLFLPNEGYNSIFVRTYYWLDYSGYKNVTYDWTGYVYRDTIQPDLAIYSPSSDINAPNHYVKGVVNVTWQCSDGNAIIKREVKLDALGWQETLADSYSTALADGVHVVNIRVTDVAGNFAEGTVVFVCDTTAPDLDIGGPVMNAKIGGDAVDIWWYGGDDLSGLDHYEIRIAGGEWIDVGDALSYSFSSLSDGWYNVEVKSVDKSGNSATSTVSFGIYSSVWSQNGPYQGIPLYGLISAIIILAVIVTLLLRKRMAGPSVATAPRE